MGKSRLGFANARALCHGLYTAMDRDIRWKQRFQNYEKAYRVLCRLVTIPDPNEGERMGLIQAFEIMFELSWKLMGDYLKQIGYDTPGPRPTIKQAFQINLIADGHTWMHMLDNRNLTTHTYNETIALAMVADIKEKYQPLFKQLHARFLEISSNE